MLIFKLQQPYSKASCNRNIYLGHGTEINYSAIIKPS